jgi:hypothetical protein
MAGGVAQRIAGLSPVFGNPTGMVLVHRTSAPADIGMNEGVGISEGLVPSHWAVRKYARVDHPPVWLLVSTRACGRTPSLCVAFEKRFTG